MHIPSHWRFHSTLHEWSDVFFFWGGYYIYIYIISFWGCHWGICQDCAPTSTFFWSWNLSCLERWPTSGCWWRLTQADRKCKTPIPQLWTSYLMPLFFFGGRTSATKIHVFFFWQSWDFNGENAAMKLFNLLDKDSSGEITLEEIDLLSDRSLWNATDGDGWEREDTRGSLKQVISQVWPGTKGS